MSAAPNPKALRSARAQRGLRLSDVAEFTNISEARLRAFEDGERTPTFKQITRLAAAYGLETYQLYVAKLPELPNRLADFRKRDIGPAQLSPRGVRRIIQAEQTGQFCAQVLSAVSTHFLEVKRAGENLLASSAGDFRSAFDNWFSKKESKFSFAGSSDTVFFSALKLYIETHGIISQSNDAPVDDYLGFYVEPEVGRPTIFVNRSVQSKKAQIFTLAHEYGHSILGRVGVSDTHISHNRVERICNQFAAEFIAPESQIISLYDKADSKTRSDVGSLINYLSSFTFLSKLATSIRLEELGLSEKKKIAVWRAAFEQTRRFGKTEEGGDAPAFGHPHAKRISELGHLPVYLAGVAISRGYLESEDVERAIGLSQGLQDRAFDLATRRIETALS